MVDYLPKFDEGSEVSFTASGTVTGGRLQAITGDRTIADSGADVSVVGVAGYDGVTGDLIPVFTRTGGVHRLVATGAIAAGAKVASDVNGQVKTNGAGTNPIGLALTHSTNPGDLIEILFVF